MIVYVDMNDMVIFDFLLLLGGIVGVDRIWESNGFVVVWFGKIENV